MMCGVCGKARLPTYASPTLRLHPRPISRFLSLQSRPQTCGKERLPRGHAARVSFRRKATTATDPAAADPVDLAVAVAAKEAAAVVQDEAAHAPPDDFSMLQVAAVAAAISGAVQAAREQEISISPTALALAEAFTGQHAAMGMLRDRC